MSARTAVAPITDPEQAELAVHPLRARILAAARSPASATEIGKELGESRQKINYHLHRLVEAGLLEPAGQEAVRGFTEKRYRTSAGAYLISPGVLAGAAPVPGEVGDRRSASYLLALTARTQQEVARVLVEARAQDQKVATLSMDASVYFADAEQRSAFARALREAVTGVIERFSTPTGPGDEPAPGARPFRLVLGIHPKPAKEAGA